MPNSLGCKSQVAWKHVSLRGKKYFEHRFPCHNNWSHTMQQPLHGLLPIKRIKFSQASSPSFSSISFPPFLFGTSHEQCPTWMFEKADKFVRLDPARHWVALVEWTWKWQQSGSTPAHISLPHRVLSHPFQSHFCLAEPHMSSALPGQSKR